MADVRPSYPNLEDGSNVGAALAKALAGDTSTAKNAQGALVAIDGASQFQYLKVNGSGELVVSSGGVDVANLSDAQEHVGSATFVDVAVVTLNTDHVYQNIGFVTQCFRDSLFKIVWNDDGTPTVLAYLPNNDSDVVPNLSFTSGSTGTQELKIQALNQNVLSELRGTLTVDEVQ